MENIKYTIAIAALTGILSAGQSSAQEPIKVGAVTPIKIGVVTPLSGTYAAVGQPVRWGLELAAEEINAAGGINKRPINLIF